MTTSLSRSSSSRETTSAGPAVVRLRLQASTRHPKPCSRAVTAVPDAAGPDDADRHVAQVPAPGAAQPEVVARRRAEDAGASRTAIRIIIRVKSATPSGA